MEVKTNQNDKRKKKKRQIESKILNLNLNEFTISKDYWDLNKCNILRISVNKSIYIQGFEMYGQTDDQGSTENIIIQLTDNDNVVVI